MKKKNWKRMVAGWLALVLALSLAGCAARPAESAATETTAAAQTEEPAPEEPAIQTEPAPGDPEAGTAAEQTARAQLTVAALKGPTGVGMVRLMQTADQGTAQNDYTFTVAAAADEITGKLVSGEIQIASVPTNLAAKLYAKTQGKVRMLAVNTLGVLQLLTCEDSVNAVEDLAGKTIYSTGEGSNPEYILRNLLQEAGVTDAKIEFVATNDELTAKILSGEAATALVPEPAATTVLTKAEGWRRAFSLNDAWEQLAQGELMMGCVVAMQDFVEQNPEAVESFLAEYQASITYAQENVAQAAALCEEFGIISAAAVAEQAIPECHLTYVDGSQMQTRIADYFDCLFRYDPSALGGALPGDDFYYHAE